MLKQDIIKARKELTAEEALDRGYRFAQIVEEPVYYSGVYGERAFDAACNDFVDWEDALCYQS